MKIVNGVLISINKSKDIKRGHFTVPDGVTSIGNYAFFRCPNLTKVSIGDSVISIGISAFKGCVKLASITIPNSVTSIGRSAFSSCSNLTSVMIGNSVTSIGDIAFYDCVNLTSITIPDSVTSIGDEAFAYCGRLTSITIPDSVTSIGSRAFERCSNLMKTDRRYCYKAFKADLTCRGFQYEENKWFECDGEIKLCKNGFHACKNAFDLFNYYYGELNKDIVIYKVELEGISDEHENDSKVVAKRIRLVGKINSYKKLLN